MIRMIVILCWFQGAAAVTHSLLSFAMATSKGNEMPQYVYMGMVDDVRYSYYNNTMKEPILLLDWMNDTMGRNFWEQRSWHILHHYEIITWSLKNTVRHFNHTGDHTYQYSSHCVLNDDGSRQANLYYAYDGEDFVSLDVNTMAWVAAVPQAVYYKHKREADTKLQEIFKNYYREECFQLLKWYNEYGMESLQKKVRPKVMLIERKSVGHDIICHVTGFYPREIEVNWIRDGDYLLEEGVWSQEVLPNGDGTYQVRKTLTVSSEDQKKHTYSCQVDHSSLDNKKSFEWVPDAGQNIVIPAVGGALVVLVIIMAVVIWKKKTSGARRSEYISAQSEYYRHFIA